MPGSGTIGGGRSCCLEFTTSGSKWSCTDKGVRGKGTARLTFPKAKLAQFKKQGNNVRVVFKLYQKRPYVRVRWS